MLRVIRCQANFFGNFAGLEPTNDLIMKFLGEMSEFKFLPNIANEVQIEVVNNVPNQKVIKRLQLISEDNSIIVDFSSNVIAINSQLQEGVDGLEISEFIMKSNKIIKKAYEITEIKGTRISLIANIEMKKDQNLYAKYINDANHKDDAAIPEWNWRRAIKETAPTLAADEEIYIISNLNKGNVTLLANTNGKNKALNLDGVFLDVDINTVPKIGDRINNSFIEKFFALATEKYEEVTKELGEVDG